MTITSAALLLLLVMDPLGNLPLFSAILRSVDESRRTKVLIRELLIALLALFAFLLFGRQLVELFGITTQSISVAGGIILFIIALRMIFPSPTRGEYEPIDSEPLIVPLAIPLVAGPSALATLLLLAGKGELPLQSLSIALFGAWSVSAVVLMASPVVERILGPRALTAMERLMGMLLVAVAVQMTLDGMKSYWIGG